MAAYYYYINCLTNLHVGNGELNFNVIDNEVEKDPVTGYPTINASGVKGALRQFFEEKAPDLIVKLFGSPVRKGENSSSTPGSLKFLSAQLLGRPARASQGADAYYMVTTKTALEQFGAMIEALDCQAPFHIKDILSDTDYYSTDGSVAVEGYPANTPLPANAENQTAKSYLKKRFGGDFLILSEATFRKLPLPVVARNYLENGESKNLWYEELVPHESVFWFAVLGSQDDLAHFNEQINGKLVRFGGNASVGCGLCILTRGGILDVKAAD